MRSTSTPSASTTDSTAVPTTDSIRPTDYLLAQLRWPAQAQAQAQAQATGPSAHTLIGQAGAAAEAARHSGLDIAFERSAWSGEAQCAYVYYALAQRTLLAASDLQPLERALRQALDATGAQVAVSRLETVFERAGHSCGQPCAAHYVVEMDPEEGWMPEISRWYDTEHMPGLAAVPGCARAQRMLNHDHGPLSLACYDLVTPAALNSPPWLAVRATAWSDIARPHFTNTLRTMFELQH
ncbi:MAG: hypothetical protein EOO29_39715, partial [Comamonadaceae bacterium]